MTNEDNTADARISNWTLATGSKPGAREVSLATQSKHRCACRARSQIVVGTMRREPVDVEELFDPRDFSMTPTITTLVRMRT